MDATWSIGIASANVPPCTGRLRSGTTRAHALCRLTALTLVRPFDFAAVAAATLAGRVRLSAALPPEEKVAALRCVLAWPAPELIAASPNLPTHVCRYVAAHRCEPLLLRPCKSSPRRSGQVAAGRDNQPGPKRGDAVGQPDSTCPRHLVISRSRKPPAGLRVPAASEYMAHLHGRQSRLPGTWPLIWIH